MRWRRWLVVILLGVLALKVGGYFLRERSLHARAPTSVAVEPFEPQGWRSGTATRRVAMGTHMAETGELVGRSRDEITARLGPPSGEGGRRMDWFLGDRGGSLLMPPWRAHLPIHHDAGGACVWAEVCHRA